MSTSESLDQSYEELAAEFGVSVPLVQALHEALGFVPPRPDDRAGEDEVTMLDLIGMFREAGAADEATLRLLSVYADSLRRIAKAEVEYYEANIEGRLRGKGLDERQLIEFSTRLGDRVTSSRERALLMIYRRHREHVWTEHAINHVEAALEEAGLQQRVPQPPAICFVDLTGYTRLTEERGDEFSAEVAGRLASLVKNISRDRGGRPIRWLGDGGMFHFREPWTAVIAGLDLVERAPAAEPGHVGQGGPLMLGGLPAPDVGASAVLQQDEAGLGQAGVGRPDGVDEPGPPGDQLLQVGRVDGVAVHPDGGHVGNSLGLPAAAGGYLSVRANTASSTSAVVAMSTATLIQLRPTHVRAWSSCTGVRGAVPSLQSEICGTKYR
jgi:class 3 adenylate cyclase